VKAWALALALAGAGGCLPPAAVRHLSPTAEAGPLLAQALAVWAEAGADTSGVYIGPGGAPVTVEDEPPGGNRGATLVDDEGGVYWVRVWRDAPARTWTHEVGHALGAPDVSAEAGASVMVSGGTGELPNDVDLGALD
jgi:hypothetical protein